MYAAKAQGKNGYEVYQPSLQVAVSDRLERTAELQQAVDEEQFVLYYQPIVSLTGGDEHRPRGPDPLAAPRAGPGRADGVHPAGRRDGPHHRHRTVGPAGGVPQGARLAN